jgi:predicted TIM-barrel fold metal-dependent hydrolase
MTIDFHTHNFPDSLAARALEHMISKLESSVLPVGDGTLGNQLRDLGKYGIDKAVMCPVATKPSQADIILKTAVEIRDGAMGEEAARRIIPFASVHPKDEDFKARLESVAKAGIKGVKVHPYYQEIDFSDKSVVPFFETVRDLGLVVVSHCGFDLGYTGAPMCCGPFEIATLFKNVPGLAPRFVAAHLGGFSGNPDRATDAILDSGCYIDSAIILPDIEKPEGARICAEWPAERILFATDYPWCDQKTVMDWVKKNRPDESDREKIFGGNAIRLLGLEEKQ